jgi:hypothetical protein
VTPGARPADLVPGEPDEVERLAARLARFATGAGEASARLDSMDATAWSGQAGALFREAVGEVPARLTRAAGAFATAARALSAYARVLREGQATAARAVRLVEQSSPETRAADQETANQLLARARAEVEEAGTLAAARLAEATADAPAGEDAVQGRAIRSGDVTVRLVTEHELTDPDRLVAPAGDWAQTAADVRFSEPHQVGFAGGGSAEPGATPSWEAWAASGEAGDRGLGVVEPGVLAALGVAAVGVTVIGRRRREGTALTLVGLDERELRRRRAEFGGARHRDGVVAPARAARLRTADAWRTRLASSAQGGTVHHWTDPSVDPLPRARVIRGRVASVDREVRGAVLRTGRPAHEGV